MKTRLTILLLFAVVLLSGCAEVSPHVSTCITSNPYGFWDGFWHGITIPFSWIGSLFSSDIAIYAYNNNGGWYDFGFVFGVGGIGSLIKISRKKVVINQHYH